MNKMNGQDASSSMHDVFEGSSSKRPRSREDHKQLPSIPDSETQAVMAAKLVSSSFSVSRSNNGYAPYFLEYALMAEYKYLSEQNIPGVLVVPSAKSPLVWFGVLFIRQGLYQDGVFKFSLSIPENYPEGDCPKFYFDFPVFHPIVNPDSGELDVQRGFHKWRKGHNRIAHVLMYARRIFFKIETSNAWNQEAAVLYEKDNDSFKKRVSDTVRRSKEILYDEPANDDPYAFRFSHTESSLHEETKNQMLNPKVNAGARQ